MTVEHQLAVFEHAVVKSIAAKFDSLILERLVLVIHKLFSCSTSREYRGRWNRPISVQSNVYFGSLAASCHPIRPMSAVGGKVDVHTSATFLIFADCSAFRPDIGFIRLALIICLAITSIEENNEISSNQTTNKTRASADTSENQGSSEGTRRIEACRPAFENQA